MQNLHMYIWFTGLIHKKTNNPVVLLYLEITRMPFVKPLVFHLIHGIEIMFERPTWSIFKLAILKLAWFDHTVDMSEWQCDSVNCISTSTNTTPLSVLPPTWIWLQGPICYATWILKKKTRCLHLLDTHLYLEMDSPLFISFYLVYLIWVVTCQVCHVMF